MTEATLGHNPRYANYARIHGRDPEAQLEEDRRRWPGGSMCSFMLWNNARHAEFHRIDPTAYMTGGSGRPAIIDHDAYDAWLSSLEVGHGVEDDRKAA